jgi:hypothetical protein
VTNVIPCDRRPQDGERPPTTGMSALRIITGMTADEFAAHGAPPAAQHPARRANRSGEPTLQGWHGAARQAAGGSSHGAGGDAARRHARRRSRAVASCRPVRSLKGRRGYQPDVPAPLVLRARAPVSLVARGGRPTAENHGALCASWSWEWPGSWTGCGRCGPEMCRALGRADKRSRDGSSTGPMTLRAGAETLRASSS